MRRGKLSVLRPDAHRRCYNVRVADIIAYWALFSQEGEGEFPARWRKQLTEKGETPTVGSKEAEWTEADR